MGKGENWRPGDGAHSTGRYDAGRDAGTVAGRAAGKLAKSGSRKSCRQAAASGSLLRPHIFQGGFESDHGDECRTGCSQCVNSEACW